MLAPHDHAARECVHSPAQGLPALEAGTLTQALHDDAPRQVWIVVGMKDVWNNSFAFD